VVSKETYLVIRLGISKKTHMQNNRISVLIAYEKNTGLGEYYLKKIE
jgi:hypothetical protein